MTQQKQNPRSIIDEVKQPAVRNAVKKIPFVNCGGFSITIMNANCTVYRSPDQAVWHTHPFYEFSLVRRGVMGYRTKQQLNRRGPGEVHFMNPGCAHRWDILKTPLQIDNFEIEFHAIDPAYSSFIRSLPDLTHRMGFCLKVSDEVKRLYRDIDEETARPDTLTQQRLPAIIVELFHRMVRLNFADVLRIDAKPQARNDRAFRLFAIANSFIEDNIDRNLSPGDVAQNLHITPRYLNQLFGGIARQSCGRYIQERKLQRAYSLIAGNPTEKIREIAYSLGYIDSHYFTRIFTKRFGISPSIAREHQGV